MLELMYILNAFLSAQPGEGASHALEKKITPLSLIYIFFIRAYIISCAWVGGRQHATEARNGTAGAEVTRLLLA